MTDDDFEIDIYGDSGEQASAPAVDSNSPQDDEQDVPDADVPAEASSITVTTDQLDNTTLHDKDDEPPPAKAPATEAAVTDEAGTDTLATSAQQGIKRKEAPDDGSTASGALPALQLSELHWATSEDEIRGWANKCGAEEAMTEITFNEHKTNGKSKGQVYVEFKTAKASSALKRYIENDLASSSPLAKKFTASFVPAFSNPYRGLTKDAPARSASSAPPARGGFATNNDRGAYNNSGRGRGAGRGNFAQRGNFAGAQNAYNQGYGGRGNMGPGSMRGNMNTGRGGRGGFQNNMNMNTNMNMGGMMPNMNMAMTGYPMMMGGFAGQGAGGYMNPAWFGAGAGPQGMNGAGNGWNNPHGAKRQRGE